jgi:hypothetical protein
VRSEAKRLATPAPVCTAPSLFLRSGSLPARAIRTPENPGRFRDVLLSYALRLSNQQRAKFFSLAPARLAPVNKIPIRELRNPGRIRPVSVYCPRNIIPMEWIILLGMENTFWTPRTVPGCPNREEDSLPSSQPTTGYFCFTVYLRPRNQRSVSVLRGTYSARAGDHRTESWRHLNSSKHGRACEQQTSLGQNVKSYSLH